MENKNRKEIIHDCGILQLFNLTQHFIFCEDQASLKFKRIKSKERVLFSKIKSNFIYVRRL